MQYKPRFFKIPKESFFLLGPRGTGKSTWLSRTFPNALRFDLLDRKVEREFLAKPEKLIDFVDSLKKSEFASSMKYNRLLI